MRMATRCRFLITAVPAGIVTLGTSTFGGSVVSNLVAEYSRVASVRCEVRREATAPEGTIRRLSRVLWERPDRLISETFSPLRRRVVSDGTHFFSHVDGDVLGFSRPVVELDEEMRRSLFVVPGSPMDLLLRWCDVPEHDEVPPSNGWRRVVVDGQPPAEILLDELSRPVRIHVFRSLPSRDILATWSYGEWVQTPSGVWIAKRHDVVLQSEADLLRETTWFENYRADVEIDRAEFERATRAFRGVRFTNEWSAIYGSASRER